MESQACMIVARRSNKLKTNIEARFVTKSVLKDIEYNIDIKQTIHKHSEPIRKSRILWPLRKRDFMNIRTIHNFQYAYFFRHSSCFVCHNTTQMPWDVLENKYVPLLVIKDVPILVSSIYKNSICKEKSGTEKHINNVRPKGPKKSYGKTSCIMISPIAFLNKSPTYRFSGAPYLSGAGRVRVPICLFPNPITIKR